jgi:malonyl-CoA reductase/3-hydroxypropionate dehydrogenase (NADP+)
MVGRNRQKLEDTLKRVQKLIGAAKGGAAGAPFILPFDASDPGQARLGIEQVMDRYGRLDVLVNNAGSTGPKQPLGNVPLTREDVDALRAQGSNDVETVRDGRQPVRPDLEHVARGRAASAARRKHH